MKKIKIGILREGKVPPDRRVPLLPEQCVEIMKSYPHVTIVVQPSDIRCIANKEYADAGIVLQEDLSDCDILMGVKEVPIHHLIPEKIYTFFSHTLKKQPHNQKLLQTIVEKKITLVDYECLKKEGNRILAFGRFAGVVGTYNAFLFYGKKYNLYDLKRAYQCFDFDEMKEEMKKVKLPSDIKVVMTGGGRVGKGAVEILELLQIRKVKPEEFLSKKFNYPVYTQLHSENYHESTDGHPFSRQEFHNDPSGYKSTFNKFIGAADIFVAGAYWDPRAPELFSVDDVKRNDFKIRLIADITCDIKGSIPTTVKASTILEPVYDFNRNSQDLEAPLSSPDNITVMAVDNLPGELPRDSSKDFGLQLINNVLPHLLSSDNEKVIEKAMIVKNGLLMPDFQYLSDYVNS